jgi:hypothetical protein
MNSTHNTSNGGTDGCLRLHWVQELVEQELLSLPEYLSSPRFLVGFVLLDPWFYVYVL